MTLRRRTPLQQRTPLVRRSSMRRGAPLERGNVVPLRRTPIERTPMKRSRVEPKLSKQQRDALAERSGGICELQTLECTWVAVDPCHRINEGMGGRHGPAAEANDRLSVLLAGCRRCHDWCHRFPAAAKREGWMLPDGADTLAEPVHYRRLRWVLLADDGTVEQCAAPVEDMDLPEVGT